MPPQPPMRALLSLGEMRSNVKAGLTIQDMAREILRQSKAKQDYAVNTANMHMETSGSAPVLRLLGNDGIDRVEPLDIQQTAHRQLGAYLGIPQKYYEKMLTENMGLLADNVNSWLSRSAETRLIRTMDGRARAFLSDRYRRIDNLDIANITLPVIEDSRMPTMKAVSSPRISFILK